MHSLRNREKKNQRILYEEEIIMGSQNDKKKNEAMGVPKKRSARLRSAVQLEISYEVSAVAELKYWLCKQEHGHVIGITWGQRSTPVTKPRDRGV